MIIMATATDMPVASTGVLLLLLAQQMLLLMIYKLRVLAFCTECLLQLHIQSGRYKSSINRSR
jgi:hypothetical protein